MPISRDDFGGFGPELPPDDFSWYHVVLTTYGAWLPGDPRGFRTRHHREHVPGDYKSPPPVGMFVAKHERSKALLQQPTVWFDPQLRSLVGVALVSRLRNMGSFVYCAAVSSSHAHILAKLPYRETRIWTGQAKKHAWFVARQRGWHTKMWAKRGKFAPVKDRRHLENVLRYVLDHETQHAWVWVWEGLSDAALERLRYKR